MNFIKQCNTCHKDVIYTNRRSFRWAIRNHTDCKKCSALKRKPKSEETCQKISNSLKGRILSDEWKEKIRNTTKQKFNTPEYKERFKIQNGGQNNPMYGKIHTEESRKKMSDNTKLAMNSDVIWKKMDRIYKSKEFKEKSSKIHKGKIVSKETRRKMRERVIRRVQKYGIHSRNFNPKACDIIDEYGKQNGYNFQHALNGGEYSCAGYMVDGYDKEKNVVIEIDEKQHFDFDGNLKEKDVKRQKEIENELKCKFIRLPFTKT